MWTGIIQGTVTSTTKHPSLHKGTMLIVQPINPVTNQSEGLAQIAVDTLGAGAGQRVLVSGDGLGAQKLLGADRTCPIRLSIAAILHDTSIQIQRGGTLMFLAKVIGNVEARMRLPGFDSKKLLLLQPIDFNQQPIRWVVIALDCTPGGGAGVGSIVTFVEGREAANPFDTPPHPTLPVDACVTAIVDSWDYTPTS